MKYPIFSLFKKKKKMSFVFENAENILVKFLEESSYTEGK